jgi:hypothetical protein
MPEDEDNPFLLKKPLSHKPENRVEEFGTTEVISFMVQPSDQKPAQERLEDLQISRPAWENAGKPVWDRGINTFGLTNDEVVDHEKGKAKKIEP